MAINYLHTLGNGLAPIIIFITLWVSSRQILAESVTDIMIFLVMTFLLYSSMHNIESALTRYMKIGTARLALLLSLRFITVISAMATMVALGASKL